jgi:hypothetical protein
MNISVNGEKKQENEEMVIEESSPSLETEITGADKSLSQSKVQLNMLLYMS